MISFGASDGCNDPFELNPRLTHLSRCWIDHLAATDRSGCTFTDADERYSLARFQRMDEYRSKLNAYTREQGVLSLSASYDTSLNPSLLIGHAGDPRRNLLMWAHYAESHRGFVIEFRPDFMTEPLKEVKYATERPLLTFEDIDQNRDDFYLCKSREWHYENEWRSFKLLKKADHVTENGFHLFRFNKAAVRSITFGCRVDAIIKEKIIDILQCDAEYRHVDTFFATLGSDAFELSFHQEIRGDGRCWSNAPEFGPIPIALQREPGSF